MWLSTLLCLWPLWKTTYMLPKWDNSKTEYPQKKKAKDGPSESDICVICNKTASKDCINYEY